MSIKGKSLISVQDLSPQDIPEIFRRAASFKKLGRTHQSLKKVLEIDPDKSLKSFLVFEEPSTRTRISFEIASHNLGIQPVLISDVKKSSMVKGETVEQTLSTLSSLNPAFIALRYKSSTPFNPTTKVPILNAGFGSYEHPTQAILDAFTIQEQQKQVKGKKVLIIGDVLHSRVSNSNLKLLKTLGAEVAFCSPFSLIPKGDIWKDAQKFEKLDDGVKWADVIMCLRIQQERHDMSIGLSIAEYRDNYHIGTQQLKIFKKDGIILHPGPYIFGMEIGQEVLKDPRCHILTQVENGVHIRAAILSMILDFKFKGD